jgi:CDP-6-deoxy-D-xylo-4-hexulose-3-dehydrase
MGFNMRPTELQGAFGIHQIKKLDHLVKRRIENANYFYDKLHPFSEYLILPPQRKNYKNSYLVFPITIIENKYFDKNQIVNFLEKHGIETRQVVAGNIVQQPVINQFSYRISGNLKNSEYVMKNSFVIGIHDGIDNERRNYISQIITEFISKKIKS